mgnify:FL=1
MKKKLLSLLLVLAMVMVFSGCADKSNTGGKDAGANGDEHYPVTFSTYNYAGEPVEFTVNKAPEKVICAYQNNIELMLRLGLGDKIVAAFGLDGPVAEDLKDEFAKIKYTQKPISKEEAIALSPDFILGWYSLFGEKNFGDVGYWHGTGCGTYMSLNSGCRKATKGYKQTIDDEFADILTIGKIFNVEEKAKKLVDDIRNEIAKIEKYTKDKHKVGIAILEDEGDSFRVYGVDTLGGDIAVKGGAKLTIGAENSENVSAEELIAKDPEAIFMIYFEGYNTPEDAVNSILKNPKLQSLQAVKNKKVFALNLTNVYCSGYRSYIGVKTIAENLYPELYK